ncbi:MAG: histidine kinase [Gemmatimonadaceae bacterium]|nr:histidine kinase [Gemmatimonadaceae bacterium]
MRESHPQPTNDEPESLRLGAQEILVIVGVWSFLALVAIAGRFLDPRIPGIAPQIAAAAVRLTLFEYFLWMMLTPPLLWFAARITEDDRVRIIKVIGALVAGLVLAVLVDAAIDAMRSGVLQPPRPRRRRAMPPDEAFAPFRRFQRVGDLGFVDDLMVYFAVLFAGISRATMLRARHRSHETVRLQAQAAQLQAQLADARLSALRAQLDPHFLFNTLNAVSALVERDAKGVRRMISRLSELLRHSLEEGASEVTLQRELDLLERYLDIMRVRFGDRLAVAIDVPPALLGARVPNLVLQPIVENAIKHAIAPRESGGRIGIAAARAGDRLVIHVRDDGPGPGGAAEPPGAGVGLANTRARLVEMYGTRQHLRLATSDDAPGTVVEISLPFRTEAT